jgi:hypothetical protein
VGALEGGLPPADRGAGAAEAQQQRQHGRLLGERGGGGAARELLRLGAQHRAGGALPQPLHPLLQAGGEVWEVGGPQARGGGRQPRVNRGLPLVDGDVRHIHVLHDIVMRVSGACWAAPGCRAISL